MLHSSRQVYPGTCLNLISLMGAGWLFSSLAWAMASAKCRPWFPSLAPAPIMQANATARPCRSMVTALPASMTLVARQAPDLVSTRTP